MAVFTTPQEIEDALWDAARGRLPPSALSALSDAVAQRTLRYTSERDRLHEALSGDEAAADLAARALFFTVADAPKVMVPLAELEGRGLLPGREPLRAADIGAGVGAMSLGLAAWLGERGRGLDVRAVDVDAEALALFEEAAGALRPAPRVRTERLDVAGLELAPDSLDLVVAGNLLNELTEHDARALVRDALAAVGDEGAVVLIEPALRVTSRALHGLRDWVLDEGLGHVFAPCTRRRAPCPSLEHERDWCHEDRPTRLPERTAKLANATGLRSYGLKFSYLVLRRGAEPLVEAPADRRALRVVSRVRKLKGKVVCTGCGEDGWSDLRLLRRHRTDENRVFERARRGDVLLLSDRDDLGKDDQVERIEPADR